MSPVARTTIALALVATAWASTSALAAEPLSVYTVNYPVTYFAERIGGDHVTVTFPAPPEGDPAFWQPDAETITRYQQADLVILNGAAYAKWVELATLRDARLVHSAAAFEDRWIKIDHAFTHSHGPGGEHSHAGWAFTTWLDPTQAIEQARAIEAAFAKARPDATADFEAGLAGLVADLENLDARLRAVTQAIGAEPVIFSHPVYQYLARRYDMSGSVVHWEPDEAPEDAMWTELDGILAEHPAHWMIWEGEPLAATVEALQAKGIESVVFDPAGNRPASGDYLSVMRANVEHLERVAQAVRARRGED